MSGKPYKAMLAALAALLCFGASLVQRNLVKDREALGLTRYTELKGAPPVLAMTTVALGGFRGLISNLLWIRANDLQDNDKFFEMVQLSDWITKLEPHFTQVWLHQAWNMAYNISVKFKDPADRWRWVERGIELLRDDGLRYNPDDVLIHRELAWFFQHKMGANLDDAHIYYKQMWVKEMSQIFKGSRPNWDELINPQTEDAKRRVELLTNKYKMDPVFMKEVDERNGPLEWRMPEASAIYWAEKGLDAAKRNPGRINPDDLITLRRVVYQSMQLSFQRGRVVEEKHFELGPNLDIIPKVSAAYEQAMEEDAKNRDHIETAHRNLLKDVVFFLYTYNREADAVKWYKYLAEKYPNKPLLESRPDSFPRNLSLESYAIGRIEEEVGDPGADKITAVIGGLETMAYRSMAIDEDDRAAGLDRLCQKIWNKYDAKIRGNDAAVGRVALPPLKDIKRDVLKRMLNGGLPPELAAVLATKTGQKWPQPVEKAAPEIPAPASNAATNVPAGPATNAPAGGSPKP
jgi:hypothetical protein